MNKTEIRKELKQVMAELPKDIKAQKDRIIYEKIIQMPECIEAQDIFIYVSMPEEAGTHDLIHTMLEQGKAVYVPRVKMETNTMDIIQLNS